MYTLRKTCRACGGTDLVEVFDLGIQPLSNDFRAADEEHAGYAPLKVLFCPNCTLGQLSVVVRPDILYQRYSYVTSRTGTMRRHFADLEHEIKMLCGNRRILEIGSNDGAFLEFLRSVGHENVFGIDPAENLAQKANALGLPTMCELFNTSTAKAWRKEVGTAGVVIARHVFCHVDDWKDFVEALEIVSDSMTLIGIEVPHAEKMLHCYEFDTVYFEHLSYFTIRSMHELLKGTNLHIHAVTPYPIHGGAIVVWLRRNDSGIEPNMNVEPQMQCERVGLREWQEFSDISKFNIATLREKVRQLRSEGNRVVGFGASAKATVMVNACGFTKEDIDYFTDTTPEKIYRLIPGTDIPIIEEGAISRERPNHAIMCAWNFVGEALNNQKDYLEQGGKFIMYVPGVRIIP